MRKLALFSVLLVGFLSVADAAQPQQRRGTGTTTTSNSASTSSNSSATAARAAVQRNARSATPTTAARAATPAVSARSATPTKAATAARAATPTVAARAGTTQKVINNGTKVQSATKNIVVSEECQMKYEGCMDSFCMLDNETGGRCICSNRSAELDAVLEEIEKLDQQSYQMATFGVEKLEMGADAEAAIAAANAAAQSVINTGAATEIGSVNKRRTLDLSLWDNSNLFDDPFEDIFGSSIDNPIDGKTGDSLHSAAAQICVAQIPECGSELSMLQMIYSQKIRSDCTAYENSLKQQRNSSAQKLAAAEQALRETALEQLRIANKYDLGQCTVEFKKCMQTTGGCGDDFSGCAMVAAIDNTSTRKSSSRAAKTYAIKGTVTTIEIAATTYDTLIAKKPLCEGITNSCVAVKDKVWDTFLKEVAPQVKSAELIAEDNARQGCISSISECFQKACKDTMDPNDPDGSYDMCLSRPGAMLNVCKIPIEACGIDASSEAKASKSLIWEYVVARLAAMRVDSCTTEVKQCLTSDDRCGKDYTQCIGLDTDTIIRMCPYDKLTGCQKVYGETAVRGDAVYDELVTMVQGIMLNIDNNMLEYCQNAVNEAMISVCGDTEGCSGLVIGDDTGSRSLEYKICEYKSDEKGNITGIDFDKCRPTVENIQDVELGRVVNSANGQMGPITPFAGVIDGTIYWEDVDIDETGKVADLDSYLAKVGGKDLTQAQRDRMVTELGQLQKSINNVIDTIEADPTVQFCMTGRVVQGMRTNKGDEIKNLNGRENARFPNITKQIRMIIANSAISIAKKNYYKKYDELNDKMMKDYVTIGERIANIAGQNVLDVRRELARNACVTFADMSSLPRTPTPGNVFGKIVGAVAIAAVVAVGVVATPFTGGASLAVSAATVGAMTAGTVIAGAAISASSGASSSTSMAEKELTGSKSLNQWNYKEVITTTYDWETLICRKCVRSQQCSNTKNPLFGSKYCKTWADPVETCDDIQF